MFAGLARPRDTAVDVDQLAGQIATWASMARDLPPSWASHGDTIPVRSPAGERVGSLLPGEGLALDCDLSRLGITRPIRGVFERSRVRRFGDKVRRLLRRLGRDEAGAITTYDGLVNARGNGQADDVIGLKSSYTTVATTWSSTFRAGGMPTIGTYSNIPNGAVAIRTNVGALNLGMTDPSGGNTKYLLSLGFTSSQNVNIALLVDLLVACGNINANSNAAQTVTSAALTRYTTGAGVLATFEITTAVGATPSYIYLSSYTNQAGTPSQVSSAQAMTPSGIVQRLQPSSQMPFIPLASGDTGVRAVSTVTLSAAMGSGVIALNLVKPLVMVPGIAANLFVAPDLATQIDGIVPLPTDGTNLGCLALYIFANTSTSGDICYRLASAAG